MKRFYNIGGLRFDENVMWITIDGEDKSFDLTEHSKALLFATETQRNIYEIDAAGYGIHWPLIDEDLSIDGLLGIRHEPPASLRRRATG